MIAELNCTEASRLVVVSKSVTVICRRNYAVW